MWCFFGSFGAALFLNRKHAKVWMLLFLLIIVVGYVVPLLFLNGYDIPKNRFIRFSLASILIFFLIAFMANSYVLNKLKKLKKKLFCLFVSASVDKEMRQFFTTANTPIFGADLKGIINEWNEVTEKITGYKKKEVLGSHWLEYTPINYEEEIKKVVRKALMGKETANYEFSSVSKDGRNIVLLVNINTRRNSNGEIIGVLILGQDITELDSYRSKLEVKVYERTLKLNEALKKQKEQNELQSKFVLTASHEFRTPLSAINFAAGSIKKYWTKMDAKKIEKKLHRIENQVVHMTELLDDILMVVQGEAGEIINNPLLLNLGAFISEIIDEVYHSFKRSHKIVLIDPQELKNSGIFIDEKLGRNIFINLISNAIKFSPEAKKVVVELSSQKKYTVIKIQDFGIGIPKAELNNIFSPFTRGENVDLIQGPGLGLSIVKEAVNLIGGEIFLLIC
jgi:PAS domain S-box-containing protein